MKALWAPTTANRPMPVAAPENQAPRPVLAEMTENMGFTAFTCLGGRCLAKADSTGTGAIVAPQHGKDELNFLNQH
ncbi:hypothetical protein SGMN_10740 [Stenotrophomonas geniculata]